MKKHETASPEWWDFWKDRIGSEPIEMMCTMEVVRLSQINSTDQSFYCKFYLTLDTTFSKISGSKEYDDFDPLLVFSNSIGNLKVEAGNNSADDDSSSHRFYYQVAGKFEDEFELKMYPFDQQELRINITSQWDNSKLLLKFKESAPSMINMDLNKSVKTRFKMDRYIHFEEAVNTSVRGTSYSQLNAVMLARRLYMPYIVTTWLRQFVITTLAFTSFAIPVTGTPSRDRLNVGVLLLITSAIGFTKEEGVVTWLDAYTMTGFITVAFIQIYHGFGVALVPDPVIDNYILLILAVAWIAINVLFFLRAMCYLFSLDRQLKRWQTYTKETFVPVSTVAGGVLRLAKSTIISGANGTIKVLTK